jgi:hypothetical protein
MVGWISTDTDTLTQTPKVSYGGSYSGIHSSTPKKTSPHFEQASLPVNPPASRSTRLGGECKSSKAHTYEHQDEARNNRCTFHGRGLRGTNKYSFFSFSIHITCCLLPASSSHEPSPRHIVLSSDDLMP